jgi:sec-independent protein translocase protein TatC
VTQEQNSTMSFIGHLEELRKRIIVCLVAVCITFSVSYFFKERLFKILMQPLMGATNPAPSLIFTSLTEAFFCYIKTAFVAGLLFAVPVIMYEMWLFVAPGLYDKEKRLLLPFVLLSSFFFIGGALFGYFICLPYAFKYLMGFTTDYVKAMPSMKEYLSLASILLFAFGCTFELPLVLTLLAKARLVTAAFLSRHRKYAVLLIFIAAAIITPTPDPVNQCLLAVPLVILYEVGIIGARIFGKKEIKQSAEGPEDKK